MKLPSKSPRQLIKKSLEKLTTEQQTIVEDSIPKFDPLTLVSIDTTKILKKNIDKSFSVRLIKWVEPYLQSGVQYSLFYTEVNHNLKVGDKVFIVGGNYDTETLRTKKKTTPLANGYTVLYVDRCKLALNIPYTGVQPTNEEPLDNFTKLYTASDNFEFTSYLNTWSARLDNDYLRSRFYYGTNNFLILNGTYSINPGQSGVQGFTSSTNLSVNPTTHGNCVLYRNNIGGQDYLIDITQEFISGSFSSYINTNNNNGKIRVMNNDLVVGSQSFKNGYVYSFDGSWKLDKTFLPVFVTEQNFVNGVFASGEWNQGLFGKHEEKIVWNGSNVAWNMGTVLNATWLNGVLDSTIEQTESYFTVIDRSGVPQIRANSSNNGGSGYNYVFDTDFLGGDIINGNIYNMAVIYGTNSNISQMENYLTSGVPTYSVNLTAGVYYNSDILFAKISNSTFISSYVLNSYIENCKSVNSEIESSIFESSTYLADNVIKIQHYQEGNVTWYDPNSNGTKDYKLYKFYITENGFNRISEFQNFYFQGLKINEDTTNPLHFWDDKFTLGQYSKSQDDLVDGKTYSQVIIQLSTPEDNRNQVGQITGASNSLIPNFYPLPSIDVMIYNGPDFNYGTSSTYPRPFLGEVLDIEEAYIIEADFISGIFQNSKWVSGNYINYNLDHSLKLDSFGEYQTSNILAPTQSLTMKVGSSLRPPIFTTDTIGSNIAFINHLKYDSSPTYSLSDTYKVTGVGSDYTLQDLGTASVLPSIPGITSLSSPRVEMKYNYLHPVKFINSEFRSGVLVRGYFENCIFYHPNLVTIDKTLKDLKPLRDLLISDTIFANNNNKFIGQTVQRSSIIGGDDTWFGGLFYNGVWDGSSYVWGTSSYARLNFQSGLFTKSYWKDGDFSGGDFYLNESNKVDNTFYINGNISTSHYNNRWSWVNGNFKGGNFELSNWENGIFTNGSFFNSNFYKGTALGGEFGKSFLNSDDTRIWSGDFTKIKVENANFTTESIQGLTATNITIRDSIFEAGIISNKSNIDSTGTILTTIWESGIFNGGEFTGTSQWLDGTFNGGKFTSYYGGPSFSAYENPIKLSILTQSSYSWQGGIFNGGEFGNASLGTNSIWYTGEFNGGIFQGRYWRNGIFTSGEFNGINGQIGVDPTGTYLSYLESYYGYWQDGVVSESKDKFIKDKKLYSDLERESTKKEKVPTAVFKNMIWKGGTFSHNEGLMQNSIFYKGIWEEGRFYQSHFNPYIQVFREDDYGIRDWSLFDNNGLNTIVGKLIWNNFAITPPTIGYILVEDTFSDIGHSVKIEVTNLVNSTEIYAFAANDVSSLNTPISNSTLINSKGFYSLTFSSDQNLCLGFTGSGTFSFKIYAYPEDNGSGYRTGKDTIWESGILEDSYFDFSTWKNGEFLSGTATGMVWLSGVSEYMNAYNILWKSGTWRNGNWFGSPYKNIATYSMYPTPIVYPGQVEDIMNNIAKESATSSIHLNNLFNSNSSFYSTINNELYSSINLDTPIIGNSIDLPTGYKYQYEKLNLFTFNNDYINTNFGNGQFISGVWENGSWIDGYRKDTVLLKSNGFTKVGGKNLAYQTSETEWTIGLDILIYESVDKWSEIYQVGDKVSVGNIVSIDLNGERRLLRDYLSLSKVDSNENRIELTVNINFPIVSIEWDSFDEDDNYGVNPRHLIYITKNVWLNGNFYNGHFDEGVWSNGLFQGKPYTNEMSNSQWIDGIFKGGHFKGIISSFKPNNYSGVLQEIHTSLIQNMEFYDENQRENQNKPLFTFKYNSWIDVVFDTDTGVNINKLNSILGVQLDNIQNASSIPVGIIEKYIENHYYSYATKDILSANAHITNAYDNNQQVYSLGWKYKEYTNFLEDVGVFDDIINGGYNYSGTDPNNGTVVQSGDLTNFYEKGFTYSNKLGSSSYKIESNLSSIPNLLKLSGERTSLDPSLPNFRNFNLQKIDNTNIEIEKLRYSYVEIEVLPYLDPTLTYVYYNNYPAPYTVGRQSVILGGSPIFLPINQANDAVNIPVATFYDNSNGTGPTFSLKVGEYTLSDLNTIAASQSSWGIGNGNVNDRISMVKLDDEYEVVLYVHDNFGGFSFIVDKDNDGALPNTIDNLTSSIKVRPKTPKTINKREYFFNKPDLNLTVLNTDVVGNSWNMYFKSIKYVEVDRIPFFDLGGEQVIKNLQITWDQMGPGNFPVWDQAGNPPDSSWDPLNTWDNLLYLNGNTSNNYINQEIKSPTYSLSEKISFDNPNLDYLS
jgi:hypothetical protein